MGSSELVLTDLQNGVFTIRLNRPKVNAFNLDMIKAVQSAFKQAEREAQARSVLFTGGRIFSAGQDVSEFLQAKDLSYRRHLLESYNPLIVQIRRIEKPVLAAIGGAVSGAALGLALACDLRMATNDARFVVGFLGIGLAPDSAVSLLLPQLIGMGRASEYAFSNAPIGAEQALAWGLVNRLVEPDQLDHAAQAWAEELAQGAVKAMGLTKRAFNKALLPNLEEVLDYEAHLQEHAGKGAEHRAGVQAFLEKRPAKFS